ncbi:MAG TPA: nicotinate-nucleotide--dimethylbenzimidazole phosphoribosyltransferase, partial [Lacipirellulaceae bacterium]|nr:nicotinate-nucleotide--dimethylbenzimidazole phosphoribosyltransferase [Lacipirellulaceae bacterium]
MSQPAASFDEIRSLLRHLPGPDLAAGTAALERQQALTKPAGALGRLEEIARFLATWQGRHPPKCDRPRVAVFAGNHGVAARGVSAYPQEVTAQMVGNFIAGGAAVNQLTAQIDGDLRVYEMDLEHPTADFTQGPAMDEERCARAIAYGMMAVEQGIDVLCLGEMGIANTTSAAALCLALHGGAAADWTGPGTGVGGAALERKVATVAAGVARNEALLGDPLHALSCSTASPAAPPPRSCARSIRAGSTTAWWRICRPSRATRCCWRSSACGRCWRSTCVWARARARRWRWRSSRPPSPAIPAWPPSPRPASAAATVADAPAQRPRGRKNYTQAMQERTRDRYCASSITLVCRNANTVTSSRLS